jgi:hypothetical protein
MCLERKDAVMTTRVSNGPGSHETTSRIRWALALAGLLVVLLAPCAAAATRSVHLGATSHPQRWISHASYDAGDYRVRLYRAGHEIGLRGGGDGCHGHFRYGTLRARVLICRTHGHVRLDYWSVGGPLRFRMVLRFTPQLLTL